MTPIGSILERNIILNGADILTAKGYTQVPNHVLVSDRLSPGAKLTYAMLLKYAWQNDLAFGETLEEARANAREEIEAWVETVEASADYGVRFSAILSDPPDSIAPVLVL